MTAETTMAAIAALTRGVTGFDALAAAGISADAIQHQVATGWLIRLKRGIFRLRDHPWVWESQLWAALFDAGPGAVVSHRSAARLHGLYHYATTAAIEVCYLEGGTHRVTLGRPHRTSSLPDAHVTTIEGFPVTTLARTMFDLAGDPDADICGRPWCADAHRRRFRRALNDALAHRGLRFGELVIVTIDLARRGRKGSALLRALLEEWGPSYKPTESDAEDLFVELLELWGLPAGERQVRMEDDDGFIGRLDFWYRGRALDVEVDSRWHEGPDDKLADEVRDRRLAALGVAVKRIPYGRLVLEPRKVRRELAMLLAPPTADQ